MHVFPYGHVSSRELYSLYAVGVSRGRMLSVCIHADPKNIYCDCNIRNTTSISKYNLKRTWMPKKLSGFSSYERCAGLESAVSKVLALVFLHVCRIVSAAWSFEKCGAHLRLESVVHENCLRNRDVFVSVESPSLCRESERTAPSKPLRLKQKQYYKLE